MFALVRYDNKKYFVIPENRILINNGECIVKNKGCRYKAFLIAYNGKYIHIDICILIRYVKYYIFYSMY